MSHPVSIIAYTINIIYYINLPISELIVISSAKPHNNRGSQGISTTSSNVPFNSERRPVLMVLEVSLCSQFCLTGPFECVQLLLCSVKMIVAHISMTLIN
jgi:hypothetical protein